MSSARDRHEELLVQLHSARDSHQVEPIRDEMNELWHDLNEEERELFDDLSEDLFIIEGKRRIAPLADGETVESVLRQVASAFQERRPTDTLAGLRKLPDLGPQHSYVLGRSWEKLGFHRGAVCFYDYAYSQQPKPVFLVSSLEALMASGQIEEALRRIERLGKTGAADSILVLESATVLRSAIQAGWLPQSQETYESIVDLVESAWIDENVPRSLRARALTTAGFAYEHLEDKEGALRAFGRAVAIRPSDATLLAHGLALLPNEREQAMRLFEKAVRLRTPLDWPYLYVARHALETQRFAEAEEICELGLAVIERPELRGRLFEWSAISAANLGRSRNEVVQRFDQAMAELPFDQTIRKNLATFDSGPRQQSWFTELIGSEPPSILTLERQLPSNAESRKDRAA